MNANKLLLKGAEVDAKPLKKASSIFNIFKMPIWTSKDNMKTIYNPNVYTKTDANKGVNFGHKRNEYGIFGNIKNRIMKYQAPKFVPQKKRLDMNSNNIPRPRYQPLPLDGKDAFIGDTKYKPSKFLLEKNDLYKNSQKYPSTLFGKHQTGRNPIQDEQNLFFKNKPIINPFLKTYQYKNEYYPVSFKKGQNKRRQLHVPQGYFGMQNNANIYQDSHLKAKVGSTKAPGYITKSTEQMNYVMFTSVFLIALLICVPLFIFIWRKAKKGNNTHKATGKKSQKISERIPETETSNSKTFQGIHVVQGLKENQLLEGNPMTDVKQSQKKTLKTCKEDFRDPLKLLMSTEKQTYMLESDATIESKEFQTKELNVSISERKEAIEKQMYMRGNSSIIDLEDRNCFSEPNNFGQNFFDFEESNSSQEKSSIQNIANPYELRTSDISNRHPIIRPKLNPYNFEKADIVEQSSFAQSSMDSYHLEKNDNKKDVFDEKSKFIPQNFEKCTSESKNKCQQNRVVKNKLNFNSLAEKCIDHDVGFADHFNDLHNKQNIRNLPCINILAYNGYLAPNHVTLCHSKSEKGRSYLNNLSTMPNTQQSKICSTILDDLENISKLITDRSNSSKELPDEVNRSIGIQATLRSFSNMDTSTKNTFMSHGKINQTDVPSTFMSHGKINQADVPSTFKSHGKINQTDVPSDHSSCYVSLDSMTDVTRTQSNVPTKIPITIASNGEGGSKEGKPNIAETESESRKLEKSDKNTDKNVATDAMNPTDRLISINVRSPTKNDEGVNSVKCLSPVAEPHHSEVKIITELKVNNSINNNTMTNSKINLPPVPTKPWRKKKIPGSSLQCPDKITSINESGKTKLLIKHYNDLANNQSNFIDDKIPNVGSAKTVWNEADLESDPLIHVHPKQPQNQNSKQINKTTNCGKNTGEISETNFPLNNQDSSSPVQVKLFEMHPKGEMKLAETPSKIKSPVKIIQAHSKPDALDLSGKGSSKLESEGHQKPTKINIPLAISPKNKLLIKSPKMDQKIMHLENQVETPLKEKCASKIPEIHSRNNSPLKELEKLPKVKIIESPEMLQKAKHSLKRPELSPRINSPIKFAEMLTSRKPTLRHVEICPKDKSSTGIPEMNPKSKCLVKSPEVFKNVYFSPKNNEMLSKPGNLMKHSEMPQKEKSSIKSPDAKISLMKSKPPEVFKNEHFSPKNKEMLPKTGHLMKHSEMPPKEKFSIKSPDAKISLMKSKRPEVFKNVYFSPKNKEMLPKTGHLMKHSEMPPKEKFSIKSPDAKISLMKSKRPEVFENVHFSPKNKEMLPKSGHLMKHSEMPPKEKFSIKSPDAKISLMKSKRPEVFQNEHFSPKYKEMLPKTGHLMKHSEMPPKAKYSIQSPDTKISSMESKSPLAFKNVHFSPKNNEMLPNPGHLMKHSEMPLKEKSSIKSPDATTKKISPMKSKQRITFLVRPEELFPNKKTDLKRPEIPLKEKRPGALRIHNFVVARSDSSG
ncbi:hypothetical protein HNY73_016739 [Argiope bruennichi]|uniref:Uncharacterized protein n=1 Tax=Argiope bruennichi TaxID=94029 RepID=A0A8T0EJU8_ARGBR|nr:hypothetical protein HNY73_016739 [Argiope bruennichi]